MQDHQSPQSKHTRSKQTTKRYQAMVPKANEYMDAPAQVTDWNEKAFNSCKGEYEKQSEMEKEPLLIAMAIGLPGTQSKEFQYYLNARTGPKRPMLLAEARRRFGYHRSTGEGFPIYKDSRKDTILQWLTHHPIQEPKCIVFIQHLLETSLRLTLSNSSISTNGFTTDLTFERDTQFPPSHIDVLKKRGNDHSVHSGMPLSRSTDSSPMELKSTDDMKSFKADNDTAPRSTDTGIVSTRMDEDKGMFERTLNDMSYVESEGFSTISSLSSERRSHGSSRRTLGVRSNMSALTTSVKSFSMTSINEGEPTIMEPGDGDLEPDPQIAVNSFIAENTKVECPVLFGLCSATPNDDHFVGGLQELQNLTQEHPKIQQQIIEIVLNRLAGIKVPSPILAKFAIPVVIHTMLSSNAREDKLSGSCLTLWKLILPESYSDVLNAGGLDLILTIMRDFPQNKVIQFRCLGILTALFALMKTDEIAVAVGSTLELQILVEPAISFKQVSRIVEQTLTMLKRMLRYSGIKKILMKHPHMVQLATEAPRIHRDKPRVIQRTLQVLYTLSQGSDDSYLSAINVVQSTTKVMAANPEEQPIQSLGVAIIRVLSENATQCNLINEADGLRLLWNAILSYPSDDELVTTACDALMLLTKMLEPNCIYKLTQSHARGILDSTEHQDSLKGAAKCIELITHFSSLDNREVYFNRAVVTRSICAVMDRCKTDLAITRAGCVALQTLIRTNKVENESSVRLCLTTAVQNFPDDTQVQHASQHVFQTLEN